MHGEIPEDAWLHNSCFFVLTERALVNQANIQYYKGTQLHRIGLEVSVFAKFEVPRLGGVGACLLFALKSLPAHLITDTYIPFNNHTKSP